MQRQTVDYGIDLGTTNSAIARAASGGVELVRNRALGQTTPSAVARTKAGQTLVGQDALNKPGLSPATKFKRLMGTASKTAMGDGVLWSPEELSAEILKDLRGSVQRRFNVQPSHVVITVPAMFQQPQCEATHRAAELAGLTAISLLQEPIAAATAYLNDDPEEGYYLVYDLGGGTFDVSIVRVLANEMSVVAHGGDNFLGGADFDQLVAEWTIKQLKPKLGTAPELDQPVAHFHLMSACERARIDLSDVSETLIDLSDLELPVDSIALSRAILEDLISPLVARTLRLTQERLDQAGLRPGDVRSILPVGGPTMTPYVRHILKESLGIPISFDSDPMTTVATGAAIAASSILLPHRSRTAEAPREHAAIELFYEPVSPEITCTIAGRVASPAGFSGEARLVRSGGDWDSGWLALRGGAFQCELLLKERTSTDFEIHLRDLKGDVLPADPASVTVRHGVAVAVPVTPYDYGVALSDGAFLPIIKRGLPLPSVGSEISLRAARSIPAGSTDALPIYFLEGVSRIAEDNAKVGEIRIQGSDLPRSLREGQTIEIRIRMDESRKLDARVSIPALDMDFKVPLTSMIDAPNAEDIQRSFEESTAAISEIQSVVEPADEERLRRSQREIEIVEAELQRVDRSEPGSAERVVQKLMPIKSDIRALQQKYGLEAAYNQALEMIHKAEQIVAQFEDRLAVSSLGDLREDAERCRRLGDRDGLKAVHERADNLFWRYYRQTPECWIGLVAWLKEQRQFASEAIPYDEYLKRADDCLRREDFEGVRLNGVQAMSYLPDAKVADGRFANSGVTK
jgi:molecular chaperone DnaK